MRPRVEHHRPLPPGDVHRGGRAQRIVRRRRGGRRQRRARGAAPPDPRACRRRRGQPGPRCVPRMPRRRSSPRNADRRTRRACGAAPRPSTASSVCGKPACRSGIPAAAGPRSPAPASPGRMPRARRCRARVPSRRAASVPRTCRSRAPPVPPVARLEHDDGAYSHGGPVARCWRPAASIPRAPDRR